MKWIVLRAGLLVFVTTVAITGTLSIGHLRSQGNLYRFLKLDECNLPCWIGIIPGKTKWSETRQYIEKAFGDQQYSVQYLDDSHVQIFLTGTPNFFEAEISPLKYSDKDSLIYRIRLIPEFTRSDNGFLSVGDLVASTGTPDDIILTLHLSDYIPVIRLNEGRIHLYLGATPCNKVLPDQQVEHISLFGEDPEPLWFSKPTTWYGFDRCYSFEPPDE